ncbi:hypothetical protein QYM36_008146, partial [Artemia franciscana]
IDSDRSIEAVLELVPNCGQALEQFVHILTKRTRIELARLLQEVEQHKTSNRKGPSTSTIDHVEQLDRDRMLAIEVQDRELARILQEKRFFQISTILPLSNYPKSNTLPKANGTMEIFDPVSSNVLLIVFDLGSRGRETIDSDRSIEAVLELVPNCGQALEQFVHILTKRTRIELARLLQEVEQHKTSNRKGPSTSTIDHVEQLDRDRMLAIEVQDRELARILQEKRMIFVEYGWRRDDRKSKRFRET